MLGNIFPASQNNVSLLSAFIAQKGEKSFPANNGVIARAEANTFLHKRVNEKLRGGGVVSKKGGVRGSTTHQKPRERRGRVNHQKVNI